MLKIDRNTLRTCASFLYLPAPAAYEFEFICAQLSRRGELGTGPTVSTMTHIISPPSMCPAAAIHITA